MRCLDAFIHLYGNQVYNPLVCPACKYPGQCKKTLMLMPRLTDWLDIFTMVEVCTGAQSDCPVPVSALPTMEIVKSCRSLNVLVTLILNTLIKGSGSSVVHSLNTPHPPSFFTTSCHTFTISTGNTENLPQFARQDWSLLGSKDVLGLPQVVKKLVYSSPTASWC